MSAGSPAAKLLTNGLHYATRQRPSVWRSVACCGLRSSVSTRASQEDRRSRAILHRFDAAKL